MKKMYAFLGLAMALLALPTQSLALPRPLNAEFSLNHGDSGASPGVLLGYQVISNKVQVLKCQYSFATVGGSSSTAIRLNAVDGSQCMLPTKAIVYGALIDVVTAVTSGGSATVSIGTGKAGSNNDILVATGKASLGAVLVQPTALARNASTAIKMSADSYPNMAILTAPLTAGKFNVYIEYLLGE